jgi:transcription termination/antitermination protein NusG
MKWYTLNVFNGKEKKIVEDIEKTLDEHNLSKYVGQILIPREKIYEMKNGKRTKTERNFYPGYILINCDMNGELLKRVKYVKGVIDFLGILGEPTPLRESEITSILKKCDDLFDESPIVVNQLLVGQEVEIITGPFSTLHGKISKILDDKKRIIVNVSIFNRKTPVELNYDQVK